MGTPRIITFLLGAWLALSLMVDIQAVVNLTQVDELLRAPAEGASAIIRSTGPEQSRLLLRYFASEQDRNLFDVWEAMELGLALVVAGLLYMGLDRRPLPLVLWGLMLAVVLAQYFLITPEMKYRGREADFPRPTSAETAGVRGIPPPADDLSTFTTIFGASEVVKIAAGGYLAGYLFFFRSRRRKRNIEEEAEEIAKAAALRAGSTQHPGA